MNDVKITNEQLKEALGSNMKSINIDRLAETFNEILQVRDEHEAIHISENMISYLDVLASGKYKYKDFASAVTYVTYKLMGLSNIDCYERTFPERYNRLRKKYIAEGVMDEDEIRDRMSPNVSIYNSNKLVNSLLEQSLIQDYILFAPMRHRAIIAQMNMIDSDTVKDDVRQKAADSLLNHLKVPETAKIEIDINPGRSDEIRELREVITSLSAKQIESIQENTLSAKDVAEMKIIDVEAEKV